MDIIIRKAKIGDSKEIEKLIIKSIELAYINIYSKRDIQEKYYTYTTERIIEYIKTGYVLIAIIDNKIVGCIRLNNKELCMMYVLPEYFGKGIGKLLIDQIITYAKGKSIDKIYLWSSLNAYAFYKKMGFNKVKDIYNREGFLTHIEMKLNI